MQKKEYIISILLTSVLFSFMLIVFFQNIHLKIQRNQLQEKQEEYYTLKEEINTLTNLQENYELTVKNNEELLNKKIKLEKEIAELNNKKINLNKEIEKIK